jgi:hypothetical protein
MIPGTDAPMTFLIPISLVLCSAVNATNPNRPSEAMNTTSIRI